jgi:phage-related protein
MIRSQASIRIARPAPLVFDFVATDFFRNYRHWSPEVVSLQAITDGPVGLGSQGRQVRIDMGVRTVCRFRVSRFEPTRRIDFQCTSPNILSSYRIAQEGEATRLTFLFEYSGSNVLLRPFRKQIDRTVQRGVEKVVRKIKDLLESQGPTTDA